jgi:hypothetical protein
LTQIALENVNVYQTACCGGGGFDLDFFKPFSNNIGLGMEAARSGGCQQSEMRQL